MNVISLVTPLNQKIGNIICISDKLVYYYPKIYRTSLNSSNYILNSKNFRTIKFQKIKIQSEVNVKFQLK